MLERAIPTYRLTDYQDNGDLLADTVNKDFDRLWMAIQQAFIYLGLALTRPLLGGPFNAKGYRIENLGEPVSSGDAATKRYVDNSKAEGNQYADNLFKRTLRVPELQIGRLPTISGRRNKILGFNDVGEAKLLLPESGSASDVMLQLAATDGFKTSGRCKVLPRCVRLRLALINAASCWLVGTTGIQLAAASLRGIWRRLMMTAG